jgi:uncharacterized membrane protein YgdD (TMEM256/DUF423 family)
MFLTVAIGAFGAHGLKDKLTPAMFEVFETGVRYQAYHALALLGVGWLSTVAPGQFTQAAGWCFVTGIAVFSGSLYILSISGARWWGAVTPIGGLAFLAGWFLLFAATWRRG